jgi:transposase, IS30 family
MLKGKSFTQLGKEERVKIEVLLHQGFTLSAIAAVIGRSVSTLSREVKRNGGRCYCGELAHGKAQKRHRLKAKHTVFDQWMRNFIKARLSTLRLSPELISVEGKGIRDDFICAEWIYQWIWKMKFSQATGDRVYQKLFKYLRHASRKRKRGNRRHKRGNILERVWIDQRPGVANKRVRKGDLECDIMLGRGRQPGLLVALDRQSRKVWIRKLHNKNAGYVMTLIKTICRQANARTITFDNDQSFAEHYRLHPLGVETFFTHPYSSQEKGSVENRIGLMRMFMPKKTDFTKVSNGEVKKLEAMINNRPLRMFNYAAPNQIHKS